MPAVARTADSPYASYADWLTRPEVRSALWQKVWRLQKADAADLISETFEALWRRRDDPNLPGSLERMIGLARHVIDAKIVDRNRRRAVGWKRIVDAARLVPRDEDDPPLSEVAGEDQPNYIDEIAPMRTITAYDHLAARQKLAFVDSSAWQMGLTDDDVEVMQALDVDGSPWRRPPRCATSRPPPCGSGCTACARSSPTGGWSTWRERLRGPAR